jgi:hypothetical protein
VELNRTLPSAIATIIQGFSLVISALQSVTLTIWSAKDAGSAQVELRVNSSGQLLFTRNGTVLGTTALSLASGTTYYIEVKATISDTVGVGVVHVNGVEWLNLSNQDTKNTANATVDSITLGLRENSSQSPTAYTLHFDDTVACDTAGSQNNDFLGDIRVQALLPDGAGNYAQWALTGAATNREAVDEVTPDDDTTYVSSPTVGQMDSYTYGALAAASGNVKAVVHQHLLRKDDAGPRTIRPLTRISATDYFGSNVNAGDSYSFIQQIAELSPASAAAWTVSEINGAEFGQDVVA